MTRYVFDIEGNDLLTDISKIHCIAATNADDPSDTLVAIGHEECRALCEYLSGVDQLIGHNVVGFDIPAITKVLGVTFDQERIYDTLLMSRLAFPDIFPEDARRIKIPPKQWGKHSLKAWGYRLGVHKTEYNEGWEDYSDTMMSYCVDDVATTLALYRLLESKNLSQTSVELEHAVAWIIEQQTRHGVFFDVDNAWKLYHQLGERRDEIDEELHQLFPPIKVLAREFVPKRDDKRRGYKKGELTRVYKTQEFNPASRPQIAGRLIGKYGWKPKDTTDKGAVKVSEEVLESLDYPEAVLLAERMMLAKRIGAISEGRGAWLKYVTEEGRIHGRLNTNGAVTGRMTHHSPNMSQVPAARKPWGKECRELFTVPKGYKLVGGDASGLEIRILAHFLTPLDGGKYAHEILKGDIHSHNQQAAGLASRDAAKTFFYAFLYGAGDAKIGSITGAGAKEGRALKTRFLNNLPALRKLRENVIDAATTRGFLRGIDGRQLPVRSPHSALNTLLQSAGGVVMKKALVIAAEKISHLDAHFVLNSHDEMQVEVLEEQATEVAEAIVESIREAGEFFGLRIPLDAEAHIGSSWAETH